MRLWWFTVALDRQKIQHAAKGETQDEAFTRILAAYPGRTVRLLEARRPI